MNPMMALLQSRMCLLQVRQLRIRRLNWLLSTASPSYCRTCEYLMKYSQVHYFRPRCQLVLLPFPLNHSPLDRLIAGHSLRNYSCLRNRQQLSRFRRTPQSFLRQNLNTRFPMEHSHLNSMCRLGPCQCRMCHHFATFRRNTFPDRLPAEYSPIHRAHRNFRLAVKFFRSHSERRIQNLRDFFRLSLQSR